MSARRDLAAVTGRTKIVSPYARVSELMGRAGEDFLSEEIQLAAIRREIRNAQAAGVAIVEGPVFTDIDRSGRDFNRTGIQQALALKAAGQIDGIAVLNVSRIGRTTSETLDAVKAFEADDGLFMSASERFDATPQGRWMLTVYVGLAEMQSDQIALGWRAAIDLRHEHGHHNGRPPVGYLRDRDRDGRSVFVVDPVLGVIVAEAFRRYSNGESATSIERDLQRRGVFSPKTSGVVKAMLGNPFYIGKVRLFAYTGPAAARPKRRKKVPGAPPFIAEGNHPPLLVNAEGVADVELFARVGKRLAREARTAPRHITPVHALGGLARCAGILSDGTICGRALTNQRKRKNATQQYVYLRCTHWQMGCSGSATPSVADVEDAVRAVVRKMYEGLVVGDAEIAASMARRATTAADRARAAAVVARLENARADADADLYADVLTPARHRAAVAKLDQRIAKAQAQLDALGEPEAGPTVEEFLTAAQRLDAEWDTATPAQRNGLLRAAGLVRVTVRKPARWREPVADRVSTTFTL